MVEPLRNNNHQEPDQPHLVDFLALFGDEEGDQSSNSPKADKAQSAQEKLAARRNLIEMIEAKLL